MFLPGESQGQRSGLPSMGSHRVGHDWSDLAAAAAISVHLEQSHHLLFFPQHWHFQSPRQVFYRISYILDLLVFSRCFGPVPLSPALLENKNQDQGLIRFRSNILARVTHSWCCALVSHLTRRQWCCAWSLCSGGDQWICQLSGALASWLSETQHLDTRGLSCSR